MSVHLDGVLMDGKPEKLKYNKWNINKKFNVSEYWKVEKFLGVYYKWGHDAKGTYTKMTMEKT